MTKRTMKAIACLCLLVATGACALDEEVGLGTHVDGQQGAQPAWEAHADKFAVLVEADDYPVVLGTKTPSSQAFTVKATHRWKGCEGSEDPQVKVVFVCKVDANNIRERCYSIEPMSTDHQSDPYLTCDSTAEPWQCMSQILANGSYHVGVLYESSTCGQYAFWWHGVLFSERQLSASLVPVNEPTRHLDHRMAQVLETPAGNNRYRYLDSVVRLDLNLPGVHDVYVSAQGVNSISSNQCYAYPDGKRWWCPGQTPVSLFLETTSAATEVTVAASIDGESTNVAPEKRVLFTGIEPRWATYLPFL